MLFCTDQWDHKKIHIGVNRVAPPLKFLSHQKFNFPVVLWLLELQPKKFVGKVRKSVYFAWKKGFQNEIVTLSIYLLVHRDLKFAVWTQENGLGPPCANTIQILCSLLFKQATEVCDQWFKHVSVQTCYGWNFMLILYDWSHFLYPLCSHLLTFADIGWHLLTFADICSHLFTFVEGGQSVI